MKYEIVEDFFIQEIREDEQGEFYDIETCDKIIEEKLEVKDISYKIREETLKTLNIPNVIDSRKKYSKGYMYNVLEYQHNLEGFSFNLGVIVWNKETKEISYKFIQKDYLDKLVSIMPKLSFIQEIIESNKKHIEEIIKEEDSISNLRRFIINYGINYPLTHNYRYRLGNSHLEFENEKEEFNIKKIIDKVYKSNISNHFKEN